MTPKTTKSPKQEISINITTHTYVRIIILTVLAVGLVWAVIQAGHSLLLIAFAFFFALALNGPVNWISKRLPGRRRGSRTLATSISFLLVIAFLGLFLASIVPPMIKQTDKFIEAAPALIKDFRSQDSFTGRFIREYGLESQVDSVSKQLSDRINNAGGETFTAAQKAGTSLFSVIAILVLTFMMLIEGPGRLKFMLGTFPERKQAVAKRLADDMYKVVKGFVNGQVILAVIASIIIFPALLVLDIGYPIALMVIVFICGLIPLVGHTVGAIIVSIVALFTSPTAALLILTYYIAYQQIENYFIQPKIQANATNMSPLLVFMAVIVGISFGGIAGGLFAIPLAGVIRILVLEYLRERELLGEQEFLEETTASTK